MAQALIEINGRIFDAGSGLLVNVAEQPPRRSHPGSEQGGRRPKPSRTLMRRAVPKPVTGHDAQSSVRRLHRHPQSALHNGAKVERSPRIQRFSVAAPERLNVQLASLPVRQPAPPAAVPVAPTTPWDKLLSEAGVISPDWPVVQTSSRRRRRTLAAGGIITALAIAITFAVNSPLFQLKIVSARSGIAARLPNWQPPGYSLAKIYGGDTSGLKLDYRNGATGQAYQLSQLRSSLSEQELASQLAAGYSNYQALVADGTTVYITGDTATWLNHGLEYRLKNSANLSASDIARLAASF